MSEIIFLVGILAVVVSFHMLASTLKDVVDVAAEIVLALDRLAGGERK